MNQLLKKELYLKKKLNIFYRLIFSFSIIILSLLTIFIIYNFKTLKKNNEASGILNNNYDIYKLYSNNIKNENNSENKFFGTIEIPKINIKYHVFSQFSDDLLKISPCKFYGESLENYGNICIAGHNYNNSKFFSNLFLLNIDDEIFIYNNLNKKYNYKIFKIYEVKSSDLSPVLDYSPFSKELTLITCNNLNNNRLIVKAQQ